MENKIKDSVRVDEDVRIMVLAEFLDIDPEEAPEVLEVSSYDDKLIEYGKQEYYVLTDDEADEEFEDYQESLMDEMGLDSFTPSFKQWILDNALDEETVWNTLRGDIREWIYDSPDSYSSYLSDDNVQDMQEEMYKAVEKGERGAVDWAENEIEYDPEEYDSRQSWLDDISGVIDDMDEDETLRVYTEEFNGDVGDYIEDMVDSYIEGYDSVLDFLNELGYEGSRLTDFLSPYLDTDAIYEEIKSVDGRGPSLAGYDGAENEVDYDGETYFIYRLN